MYRNVQKNLLHTQNPSHDHNFQAFRMFFRDISTAKPANVHFRPFLKWCPLFHRRASFSTFTFMNVSKSLLLPLLLYDHDGRLKFNRRRRKMQTGLLGLRSTSVHCYLLPNSSPALSRSLDSPHKSDIWIIIIIIHNRVLTDTEFTEFVLTISMIAETVV